MRGAIHSRGCPIAERSQVSGYELSIVRRATAGPYGEATKLVSEASANRNQPPIRTVRGEVCELDRLFEPVRWCRATTPQSGPHHGRPPEHPGVKRAACRVHGLSIGTQEPARHRRRVARRLALWSRARVARRDGVPVVVRGRESRPHGEGEQVTDGFA